MNTARRRALAGTLGALAITASSLAVVAPAHASPQTGSTGSLPNLSFAWDDTNNDATILGCLSGCPVVNGDLVIPATVSTLMDGNKNVVGIADGAFMTLGNIQTVSLPSSLTSIGAKVFGSGVKNITVDAGNPSFSSTDGVLYNKTGSTLVAYPANKAGSTFDIPAAVTSISASAFGGCGLTTIDIPATVTAIDHSAYDGCSHATMVRFYGDKPTVGAGTFVGLDAGAQIYRKATASGWGATSSIDGVPVVSALSPAITGQPMGATVTVGHSFAVTAQASGTGTLSYQWSKDGSPIAGATAATYSVSSAAAADSGSYTVAVSSNIFGPTATSSPATVVVGSTSGVPGSGTPGAGIPGGGIGVGTASDGKVVATLRVKKSTTAKALVTFYGNPVKGYKISKVSAKGAACKVKGQKITGKKVGTSTISVKAKKGKKTKTVRLALQVIR